MRTNAAVSAFTLSLVSTFGIACGDAAESPTEGAFDPVAVPGNQPGEVRSPHVDDARRPPSRSPSESGISGTVLGSAWGVVPKRAIVIVDAAGTTHDLVTDDAGAFSAPDVVVPYDVSVAADDFPDSFSRTYLGLRSRSVVLEGENSESTKRRRGTLQVSWMTPTCVGGPCRYSLMSRSQTRSGGACDGTRPSGLASASLPHLWFNAPNDLVDIALLVVDAAGTKAWWGQRKTTMSDGAIVQATVSLQAVAMMPPTTASAISKAPGAWSEMSLSTSLEVPGWPGVLSISSVQGTSLSFQVPDVPFATFRVVAHQRAPSPIIGSVYASQRDLPLSTASVTLALPDPFPLISPKAADTFSTSSGVITMRPGSPGSVRRLTLTSEGKVAVLLTEEQVVPVSQLALLGVGPRMNNGSGPSTPELRISVSEQSGQGIDALVSGGSATLPTLQATEDAIKVSLVP